MKIEVGKSYINAIAEVTTILDVRPLYSYPFICKSFSYTKDGYKIQNKITSEDLICEVVEDIYDDYALGYITQKEFIEKHIEYWTKYEQTNL